jgi:hypothetical protein
MISFISTKFLTNLSHGRNYSMKHSALRCELTNQKKKTSKDHKLKFESALLSALLACTRNQFLCQFLCFLYSSKLVNFSSCCPFKIIVFDYLNLPGPPRIDPDQIWRSLFFMILSFLTPVDIKWSPCQLWCGFLLFEYVWWFWWVWTKVNCNISENLKLKFHFNQISGTPQWADLWQAGITLCNILF